MGAPVPRIMPMPQVIKPPPYKFIAEINRNESKWYQVRAYHPKVMSWIRSQSVDDWLEEHGRLDQNGYGIDGKRFVMIESLYMMFKLTWGHG